ncbi:MAG: 16S rRNA (cytidine(1402)-2'-O)-methyltransferase, partial [Rudaea sp.]
MPVLYLVGTPIGNLEDITPRALQVLRDVSLIAAEDTRTAKQLLAHFDIRTPVTSYYEHNKLTKLDRILQALEMGDVAVVSEAGMPGLSDPGYELVRAALARNVQIVPVPGPSAILAALVGSGLAADGFYYLGFLPREPRLRRRLLRSVARETTTLIAFEAPHRLCETLQDLEEILDGREIAAARELTKVFEEFQRGPIPEVRRYFEEHEPRGEFTLVIAGAAERRGRAPSAEPWDAERVKSRVRRLLKQGVTRTEAVKRVASESH